MAFGTNKIVQFASRMGSIKSMFKTAYDNASKLKANMEKELKSKNAQIASLYNDIETINVTKKEAENFMENISKFI